MTPAIQMQWLPSPPQLFPALGRMRNELQPTMSKRRGWGGVKEERIPSREQTALGAGRWESVRGPLWPPPPARCSLGRARWGCAATWRKVGALQPWTGTAPGAPPGHPSFLVSPLPKSLTAAAPPKKWAWRRPPFLTRGHSSSGSPQGGPPAGPGHSVGSCPQAGSPGCCGPGHTAGR